MIFSKNFNFNGKWQTVELTGEEIEILRIRHMQNLIDLLKTCELIIDKKFGTPEAAIAIFDKLALQFYSVILAELDQKIYDITHEEEKEIQRLKDEKHDFDEEVRYK